MPRALVLAAIGLTLAGSVRCAHAAEPVIGLLVETTSASPSAIRAIEHHLGASGARVVGHDECAAAVRFFALTSPLDDASAEIVRRAIAADRLLTIGLDPDDDDSLLARFADPLRRELRIGAVTPKTFVADVERLLRSGPPLAGVSATTDPRVPAAFARTHEAAEPPIEYGRSRTVEIAISGGMAETDQWVAFDGNTDSAHDSRLILIPSIAYFPVDALMLSVEGAFERGTTDFDGPVDEDDLGWEAGLGLAVLPRAGDRLRIGPRVTGGAYLARATFRNQIVDDGAIETVRSRVRERGARLTAGIVLKAPAGRSAMMTVEARYFTELGSVDVFFDGAQYEGTVRRSGGEVAFGISFWKRRPR